MAFFDIAVVNTALVAVFAILFVAGARYPE